MNLSRVYSVLHDDNLSVGRVQTPTLAMIVDRELSIRAFVPEEYREVVATFSPSSEKNSKDRASYKGMWLRPAGSEQAGGKEKEQPNTRLPIDPAESDAILARARTGQARIASLESEAKRMGPPPLYDLTELQRHAKFAFSTFSRQVHRYE